MLFVIYLIYQKNIKPTIISSTEFNVLKDKKDLPPPLQKTDDVEYVKFLGSCNRGQCAINLTTGIKRCPLGENTIIYDQRIEACTNKFSCDNQKLPFPVLSDGSTGKTKYCEKGVECRCQKVPLCPSNNLSYFNFITVPITKENIIEIEVKQSALENPGEENIVLQNSNQFCKIIPSQATQILNSCDWEQSSYSPLNCKNKLQYGLNLNFGEGNEIGSINSSSYINYFDKFSTNYQQPILNILLNPGYNDLESYNIFVTTDKPNIPGISIGGENVTLECFITNMSSTTNKNGQFSATMQIINFWDPSESKQIGENIFNSPSVVWTTGSLINLVSISQNCFAQQSPAPNYKNMLMCTQSKNNICNAGYLTYNFDQITNTNNLPNFSRKFCQYSALGDDYLNSASAVDNTISCSLGNGCNGKFLEIREEAEKYFPDFDMDGIKNVITFPLSSNSYSKINSSIFNLGNYNPDNEDLILRNNVTKGDIWKNSSLNDVTQIQYTGVSQVQGNLNSYSVNDFSIFKNFETGKYKAQFANNTKIYEISNTTVLLSSPPEFLILLNILVTPSPNPGDIIYIISDVGDSGVIKEENNKITLNTFQRNTYSSFIENNTPFNFIKQFGYNGFNYNTEVGISGDSKFYRLNNRINMSSPYIKQTGNFTQKAVKNNSLNSKNPFETEFSMYYPVWNETLLKQECIRCKPSLFTFCKIFEILPSQDTQINQAQQSNISDIIIQYSGRDFLNYEYNPNPSEKNFVYTSLYQMADTKDISTRSTSNKIFILGTDVNIELGDYIIDSNLELNSDFTPTKNFTKPSSLHCIPETSTPGMSVCNNFSIQDLLENCGINESTNSDIIFNGEKQTPSNLHLNYNIESNSYTLNRSFKPKNYFFGKYYNNSAGTSGGIYITPKIRVLNVSDSSIPGIKEITTSSPITYYINTDNNTSFLQFCRLNDPLQLDVISPSNIIQSNLALVDKISDGRITNIKINQELTTESDPGLNIIFTILDLPPTIKIKNYIIKKNE